MMKRRSAARGRRELTSLTNVSAGSLDDLPRRVCLGAGLGDGGKSWDRLVVEFPAVVVGVADASSEDSETVDSSRLTPAMVGSYFFSTDVGGAE